MKKRLGWILPSFLLALLCISLLFATVSGGSIYMSKQVDKWQEKQLLWLAVQEKLEEIKADYIRGVLTGESTQIKDSNGLKIRLTVTIHEDKNKWVREYCVQGKGSQRECRYTLWMPQRRNIETTGLDTV